MRQRREEEVNNHLLASLGNDHTNDETKNSSSIHTCMRELKSYKYSPLEVSAVLTYYMRLL